MVNRVFRTILLMPVMMACTTVGITKVTEFSGSEDCQPSVYFDQTEIEQQYQITCEITSDVGLISGIRQVTAFENAKIHACRCGSNGIAIREWQVGPLVGKMRLYGIKTIEKKSGKTWEQALAILKCQDEGRKWYKDSCHGEVDPYGQTPQARRLKKQSDAK